MGEGLANFVNSISAFTNSNDMELVRAYIEGAGALIDGIGTGLGFIADALYNVIKTALDKVVGVADWALSLVGIENTEMQKRYRAFKENEPKKQGQPVLGTEPSVNNLNNPVPQVPQFTPTQTGAGYSGTQTIQTDTTTKVVLQLDNTQLAEVMVNSPTLRESINRQVDQSFSYNYN
jgi:hypothetical protein